MLAPDPAGKLSHVTHPVQSAEKKRSEIPIPLSIITTSHYPYLWCPALSSPLGFYLSVFCPRLQSMFISL